MCVLLVGFAPPLFWLVVVGVWGGVEVQDTFTLGGGISSNLNIIDTDSYSNI